MNRKAVLTSCLLVTLVSCVVSRALAGGGGESMLLVVNPNDPASLQIANAYAALRDIPANNILFVSPPSYYQNNGAAITQADVMSDYLFPIAAAITARGLTNQINYIGTIGQATSYAIIPQPSTTATNANSLNYALDLLTPLTNGSGLTLQNATLNYPSGPTSALYQDPNNIPIGDNPAINHAATYSVSYSGTNISTQYYMSGTIGYTGTGGNTAAQVIASLQNAVASDGTRPTGTIYFENSGDIRSTTRESEWPATEAQLATRAQLTQPSISSAVEVGTSGATPQNRSDVLGAACGSPTLSLPNGSTYVPGSWADNLTSFGCDFLDTSQTKATAFIAAGASGTTGSVAEPYAIPARFTNSSIYTFIADGSTFGEAFAKSVASPDMQMPLGDMLAQPFADVPKVAFTAGPANYTPALGSISISGSAGLTFSISPTTGVTSPQIATGISSLELLVDGLVSSANTLAGGSGTFNLSTAGLSDGVHEVRIVAINNSNAASEGFAAQQIVVDNHGRSINFNGGNLTLTSSAAAIALAATAGDGTVSQVELTCLGRVVAQAGGLPGSLILSPTALAPGDNVIVPVAVFGDGMQVAGGAFVVHVATGAVNSWNNGGGTWLWSNTSNWTNGTLPQNGDGVARFSGSTSGGTVTVDASAIVTEIDLDGAPSGSGGSYTISALPGQSLTLSTTDGAAAECLVNVLSGKHVISAPLTLAAQGNLFNVTNPADSLTISGNMGGVGALTKTGNGLLLLSGSNSYLGATNVSAGTLALGAVAALPAGTAATVNGTLDLGGFGASISLLTGIGSVNHSGSGSNTLAIGSGVFAGTIENSGGTLALLKTGNGQLNLSGVNTYTGGTNVSGGVLSVASTASLPGWGSGAATVNSGAILAVQPGGSSGWGDQQIGTLLGSIHWSDSTASFGIDTTSGNFTCGASITQAVGLTKLGANTLTLTGSNTYSGVTAINSGILALGSARALGGGPITFGGGVLQFTGSNTADYSAQFANSSAGPITIDTNGQSVSFGSAIAGSNTAGLVKIGNGMLILGGSNGYAGGTYISGGTLVAANNSALSSGPVVLAPSSSEATLEFTGPAPSIGSLAGTGLPSVVLGNGASNTATVLTVGSDNTSTTFSGSISDLISSAPAAIGSFSKVGSGTLTLTGINTYSGSTSVTSGVLETATTASLPGYNLAGKVAVAGGAILAVQLGNGASGWSSPQIGSLLANTTWANSTASLGIDTANGNASYNGSLSPPSAHGLTKLGANTLLLTGSSTYSGPTTVAGGTLAIGDGNTPGTGLTSPSVSISSGATLLFDLPDSPSYGGTILGLGQLLKAGTGQLTLTGTNAFGGVTTVTAGTLRMGSPGALSAASSIVASGGTLDLGGNTFTQAGASILFTGGIVQNGGLSYAGTYSGLPGNGATAIVAAGLGGSAALNMAGSGTLLLTGVNNYTGGTSVTSGVLEAATTASLPGYNTNTVSVAGGAVLAVETSGGTANGWNATQIGVLLGNTTWSTSTPYTAPAIGVNTKNGDFSYGGSIPLAIGLTKLGANNLTLTAANTISGNLVSAGPGTLTIASTLSFGAVDSAYNPLGIVQIHQGQISVIPGGVLTNLSEIDIGDTPGQTGTLTLSGTALVQYGSNYFSGVNVGYQGGTGLLNLTGSALLDASAMNGAGVINVVEIGFDNNRTAGSSGTVTVAGNSTLRATNGSAIIAGDGGNGILTMTQSGQVQTSFFQLGSTAQSGQPGGTGTLYLAGGTLSVPQVQNASGSTGNLYFNGGRLQATAASSDFLQSSGGGLLNAYVQAGGAMIDTNGNEIAINLPLAHDPGLGSSQDGGLTKVGSGVLTLTATNSYNGGTTINAGTLAISSPANLGSGGLTFGGSGGGTLDILGTKGFSSSLSITLSQNGSIQQDAPGTVTLTGPINGSGDLILTGSGVLALGGTNSYSGETVVTNGRLEVLNALALSNNALIVGNEAAFLPVTQNSLTSGQAGAAAPSSGTNMNAVPEPGTRLLLLVAGSGLIWLSRRRSKSARRVRRL
jgi:autotransporter-associated beta strand protein